MERAMSRSMLLQRKNEAGLTKTVAKIGKITFTFTVISRAYMAEKYKKAAHTQCRPIVNYKQTHPCIPLHSHGQTVNLVNLHMNPSSIDTLLK